MHCHHHNDNTILMIDRGRAKRQPCIDNDIALAIINILKLDESRGQTYELGGPHVYSLKELFEFLANNLNQRHVYVNYTYDDFMRMNLSPNSNWEVLKNLYYF